MVKRLLIAGLLFIAFIPSQASCQDIPSDKHLDAAAALLEVMNVEDMMHDMANMIIDMQMTYNPELQLFENEMRLFFNKYFNMEYAGHEFINLYASAFTEEELHELVAFYETETGQKVLHTMPQLMQDGALIGQKIVEDNQEELEQIILRRIEEFESEL